MLQTIFLCCSSSSGHWRVVQTYYQCIDVNAKISQNSLFKYIYFSTLHTIQFITVNRYLKVWEILLGTEHVIITLWQMSETIPGFVCFVVVVKQHIICIYWWFLCSDSIKDRMYFNRYRDSMRCCNLSMSTEDSDSTALQRPIQLYTAPRCVPLKELDICIWTYT